ncbi:hypothetical protein FRB99_004917 [Tulasnella sp. 403]|nr:hypothetical protein FRB99_004917 [Tulasnella sp. 403]
MTEPAAGSKNKSDSEWRAILSSEQFKVLRGKGTERPGTGKYDKFTKEGIYACAACGTPLYKSDTKFNSGCGWPAFFDGKSFDNGEGFPTPTDERHCVNSISLNFHEETGE